MNQNHSQFIADVSYFNAYTDKKQCYLLGSSIADILGIDYPTFLDEIKMYNNFLSSAVLQGATEFKIKPFREVKDLVFLRDNSPIRGYKDDDQILLCTAFDILQLKMLFGGSTMNQYTMEDLYNFEIKLQIIKEVLDANNAYLQLKNKSCWFKRLFK